MRPFSEPAHLAGQISCSAHISSPTRIELSRESWRIIRISAKTFGVANNAF